MERLHNLDYLRGISALGIMIYHYLSWTNGTFLSESIMGRIGIYGVSIFYVLSGLTLCHVYFDRMKVSRHQLLLFFKRRVLRIFPLLWLVTIAAILISRRVPNFWDLFLNLTGLFGFVKWQAYFSPGVWSIGNELVFYACFPVFVFVARRSIGMLTIVVGVFLVFYLYFGFFSIDSNVPLRNQWSQYIHPLNQAFLFIGGCLLGRWGRHIALKNSTALIVLFCAITVFSTYPVYGDTVMLVTGSNRLVFGILCFIICFCFFKLTLRLPLFLDRVLSIFGQISYSVYLVHPIVWSISGFIFSRLMLSDVADLKRIVFSVVVTIAVSFFIYNYFERYFINIGRDGLSKQKKLPSVANTLN